MFYSIIITQDETASCKLLQVFSFPSRLKEDKISFHVIMEAFSSAEVQSESVGYKLVSDICISGEAPSGL